MISTEMKYRALMGHLKGAIEVGIYGCLLGQVRACKVRKGAQKCHAHPPQSADIFLDSTKRY
jgi:hypothetical protein